MNVKKITWLLDWNYHYRRKTDSILQDEAFVVENTDDNFVDLSHEQLML